jgi:hypothetical protein
LSRAVFCLRVAGVVIALSAMFGCGVMRVKGGGRHNNCAEAGDGGAGTHA